MGRVHDPNVARIAEQLTAHEQQIRALKNRKPGLAYSSIENGAIDEYDESGQLVSRTGRQHDGTHGHVVQAGPRPMVPSRPQANALAGLVEVRWNGKFEGDQPSPLDFKHVAGYVVPEGEDIDLSHQSGVVTSELGDNFQMQVDPGTYWVYLVTWTLAGKFSEPSERAVVEVHLPADVAQIEAKLDELDEKYDGVITEAGRLGEVLEQAEQDLAAHEDRMNAADDVLAELQDETLPALRSSLDELENTTLPAMDQRLSQAQQELADAGAALSDRLDDAEALLDTADQDLKHLQETVIPGIDQRIADAQADLSNQGAQLSDRLDDAFIEIDAAAGVADEAKTAAQGAQSVADDAADAAAAAAGIAGAKADVLIQSTAPATAMRKATTLWIDTTGGANTPKRWSGSAWVAVTDKAATDAAAQAAAAQAAAAAAQSAAGSAQTTANSALAMAGTKNAVYYSTAVATGTGTRQGDLWRQVDSTGDVIGEWQWTGTSWAKRMISSSAISNLDVGKLTAGTSFISEAVINKLWAEVITARKIFTENLAVGSFDNIIANPGFAESGKGWVKVGGETAVSYGADGTVGYMETITTTAQRGAYSPPVPVSEGDKYRVKVRVEALGGGGTGDRVVQLFARMYAKDGSFTTSSLGSVTVTLGSYALYAQSTIPTGVVAVGYGFFHVGGDGLRFSKPTATRMADGNIVATGSITGDHVEGNSVAAKIAQFLQVEVGQLVAGSAVIDQAVANKIWAEVVAARKIFAENIMVGSMDNLVVDQNFDNADLNAIRLAQSDGVIDGPLVSSIDGRQYYRLGAGSTDLARLRLVNSTSAPGFRSPVVAGEKYRVRYMAYGNGGAVRTRAQMSWLRSDGSNYLASADEGTGHDTIPASVWAWVDRVFTVPNDVVAGYFAIYRPADDGGGSLQVKNPQVTRMAAGNIIATGSITGDHVEGNSVAAKIGQFLELDVSQLRAVSGAVDSLVAAKFAAATASIQTCDIANLFVTTGTMSEAVINKLWADVVHSRLITAEMLAIGAFDNIIRNPGFDEDGAGWDKVGGANVSFGASDATGYMQTSAVASQQGAYSPVTPVAAGDKYRVKIKVEASGGGGSGSQQVQLYARFYTTRTAFTIAKQGANVTVQMGQVAVFSPVEIPAGITAVQWGFTHPASVTTGLRFSQPQATRMSGGELIVDGSVTAESLAANAVTAAKADFGSFFADTGFVASLRSKGVQIFDDDGAEVINLTGEGDTVITINDSTTGKTVASIGADGKVSARVLSSTEGAQLDGGTFFDGESEVGHTGTDYGPAWMGRDMMGQSLVEHMQQHPQIGDSNAWMTGLPFGEVINAWREDDESDGVGWRFDGQGGQPHYRMLMTTQGDFVAGRSYLLSYRGPSIRRTGTGASNPGSFGAALVKHSEPGGGVAVATGPVTRGTRVYFDGGENYTTPQMTTLLRCAATGGDIKPGRIQLGIEYYVYAGITAETSTTNDASRWEISVVDVGISRKDNDGVNVQLQKQGTATADPVPPPKPPAPKTYTKTWSPSWTQTYFDGGASKASANWNGEAAQGYYNATTGYMKGLVGFPSMTAELSGATIKKIEVYVFAEHWWYGAGGTLVLGTHGSATTTAPATYTAGTSDLVRKKLGRGQGAWITMPSSTHPRIQSGSFRGIMAYIASTSKEYYGALTGSKTRIRVTYEK